MTLGYDMTNLEVKREAMLYESLPTGQVHCNLCPHHCIIDTDAKGICQVRKNIKGRLYTLVFGNTIVQNLETIEKKPLYHFFPGSTSYTISTEGCNLRCQYCTNWQVSQVDVEDEESKIMESPPQSIVDAAQYHGCQSIAYSYVEPTIFFEYMYEIGRLGFSLGLKNIIKTNGFMTVEALEMIEPYLEAANVDLKAFRNDAYKKMGGQLQSVLCTLKKMKSFGIWIEVTTVIIPGINDDPSEIKDIASFIVNELGKDTPWHLARFFPAYKMSAFPPTSNRTLYLAKEIGLTEGLNYVYLTNFLGKGNQDTFCPRCRKVIIERNGSSLVKNNVKHERCPNCKMHIAGVGL